LKELQLETFKELKELSEKYKSENQNQYFSIEEFEKILFVSHFLTEQ